jgi:S-formylglutathione hydrolase
MGGHGAILVGIGNGDAYRSVSAFAPIAAASRSEWGRKAFRVYLGEDESAWRRYDASEIVRTKPSRHTLLVDQGSADPFLDKLRPQDLKDACAKSGQKLVYNERRGYDHGYYFVSTFIGEHLRFHAEALR